MTAVLVVGAGSIGARHARNLRARGAEVVVVDADDERAAATATAVGCRSMPLPPLEEADFEAIVIATPTNLHAEQTRAALEGGARLLVEKPLGCTEAEVADLAAHRDRVMVGFNLRFHEPVRRVVELARSGAVGPVESVRLWFGSWLPDWRPQVDYRSTYSANAAQGGGVLLDAIHELDVLAWLAGEPGSLSIAGSVVATVGPLALDVEDTVRALFRHRDGWVAEVALDYLSRRYRRGIEVVGREATARFDWARAVIEVEGASTFASFPARHPVAASYELEADAFLAFVEHGTPPPVDAETALHSLRLTDAIRAAAG